MKILFLCTGNSCRSQMAEGWARAIHKDTDYEFYSAGTKEHGLNPRAVQVMAEDGVDISTHHSKTLENIPVDELDVVFTVCSDADENCPVIQNGKVIHVGFDDPPFLTKEMNDEASILPVYRRVRDEIKSFIQDIESHL